MSLNPKDIACSSIFPVPDSLPVQLGFLDNDFLSGICVCFFLFPPGLHYDEGVDFINPGPTLGILILIAHFQIWNAIDK